jgi:uncharacterized protein (DUF1330 family)
MSSLEPTAEQFAELAARPPDEPVVMVNLLKFKQPGGLERYMQYGQEVVPHLQRAGAKVRFGGTAPGVVVGEEAPWWEVILIVEYPSPAAFIGMVTGEEYLKIHEHRAAALDRGDLIATSAWMVDSDLTWGQSG